TWVYTATYAVNQTDIDNGKITNQASVNAATPDASSVTAQSNNNITNVITICTDANINIAKTNDITIGENGCATLVVGDVVTYTFTVRNSGNVSLNNVNVVDNHIGLSAIALISGDINNNNILEVTETWVYTATYAVNQTDIDNGKITNQASVNAATPDASSVTAQSNNNIPDVITICTDASISIAKTNDITIGENGCATLVVGDVVTYTFTVRNSGNVSLNNVNVVDNHIGLSAIALISGDTNNNSILEVTETWLYTATYAVNQTDIDNGKITNQASVTAATPDASSVTAQSNNNIPDVIIICTDANISITKTNDITIGENVCATLIVGNIVTYTFTVKNSGNVSLNNVNVVDNHIGLSAIALISGDTNNNNILEVTETWVYTATYAVNQTDIDNGKITNQASVNAATPDASSVTAQSNNNIPDVITICTDAKITVTKDGIYVDTNKDGITNVGDHINYSFVVTNTGNLTLANIIVTDNRVTVIGGPITLTAGMSNGTAFTATYTVTQADIDKGYVYNLATTTGTPPSGDPVSATSTDPTPCSSCPVEPSCTDCTITPLTQTPSLTVDKIASPDSNYTFVGDVINYTIQVSNSGNLILHKIEIKDPLTGLNVTIESLIPGAFQIFNVSYTVTKNDLVVGSVTNIATATGLTPKDVPVNATDTEVVDKSEVFGCGSILVHNAFSPNGDGINESFVIDNIDDTDCYPDNTVEIYNRWGVLVFETKNYSNISNNFNGYSSGRTTVSQSSGLPSGVYFYILKYTSVDDLGNTRVNQKDGYLYLTR
ncbi:gliding motility-associated C-terminal domain-containing protein, partial [Flavobacterium sp. XN-5]|uniref:gliding motility-associated C-terminal domain-containing protein n=1 Tax=Flavobacterium sp. XN-5 TaxID=2599390 RepID=UPI0011C931E0